MMESCFWTRTVANGVAGDRESRRRKKLAVLCRSVVLKSPGTHLVSHPAARESPLNRSGSGQGPETVVSVATTSFAELSH